MIHNMYNYYYTWIITVVYQQISNKKYKSIRMNSIMVLNIICKLWCQINLLKSK
jgi:hypothetical protein